MGQERVKVSLKAQLNLDMFLMFELYSLPFLVLVKTSPSGVILMNSFGIVAS